MTDRDRLIDDINDWGVVSGTEALADRLIALGWTRLLPSVDRDLLAEHDRIVAANAPLDEERLARALHAYYHSGPLDDDHSAATVYCRVDAAAIAEAYREDAG